MAAMASFAPATVPYSVAVMTTLDLFSFTLGALPHPQFACLLSLRPSSPGSSLPGCSSARPRISLFCTYPQRLGIRRYWAAGVALALGGGLEVSRWRAAEE
ncbi:hypothetical protein CG747_32395 [Streptomyces sp. CB02959]|nr:hypothetical protein CG747_32395 [Streptomyces sp. CB02959]